MTPNIDLANESELITIICHDPFATPDDIYQAKQRLSEIRKPKKHYPKLQQRIKPAYPR